MRVYKNVEERMLTTETMLRNGRLRLLITASLFAAAALMIRIKSQSPTYVQITYQNNLFKQGFGAHGRLFKVLHLMTFI